MKLKKIGCAAAICVAILCYLCVPVYAEEKTGENLTWQENIMWEWVEPSQVEWQECDIMPLSVATIEKSIDAHTIKRISSAISLRAYKDTVIFNCSYSPTSASMDFGILSSDNKFYSINAQNGKINQSLGVSYSGDYYIAIRNNSDQSVTVSGTVQY